MNLIGIIFTGGPHMMTRWAPVTVHGGVLTERVHQVRGMRIAGRTRHELHGGLFYPAKGLIVVSVFSQAGQTRICRAPRSSTNTAAPSVPGLNVCQQTQQRSDGAFARWGVRHQRADVINLLQFFEVPGMTVGMHSIARGFST
jgi:hypothetical protein